MPEGPRLYQGAGPPSPSLATALFGTETAKIENSSLILL